MVINPESAFDGGYFKVGSCIVLCAIISANAMGLGRNDLHRQVPI
jgi:hypothetical protein